MSELAIDERWTESGGFEVVVEFEALIGVSVFFKMEEFGEGL